MRDWQGKRYWIIGASEGLGRSLARQLSRTGASLILSARTEERLAGLVEELPGRARAVAMDVTDQASVDAAVAEVGEVDGIVYLAGAYWPMGADEWDAEKVTVMADVNYLGALRVLGAVVPGMVERDKGHIVITGSQGGFRGLPGAVGYVPSKAALMSLAESMHADLRHTNVEVQLVNPGFIKTRLTDKNDFPMPFLMEPEDAARRFFEHMNSDDFKSNFPTLFSLMTRMSQFLPDWLYYPIVSRRK